MKYTITTTGWKHETNHLEWAEALAIAVSELMNHAKVSCDTFSAEYKKGKLISAVGQYLSK